MAKVSGISPDKILQVAEAIISAKGIRDTSLKDIAKAAGISKGTLYYHYASKESLIYDIAGRHFDQVGERLLKWIQGIKGETSRTRILTMMLENILESLKGMARLHLYLLQETINNEEFRGRFAARYEEWQGMLARMLNLVYGEDEEKNPAVADVMLALIEGYMLRGIVSDTVMDAAEISIAMEKFITGRNEQDGNQ